MFLVRDLVSARTWLAMAQHLAGLFIGLLVIFIITTGLSLGFSLLFVALIGLPLLGITLRLADWFARAERARFAFFLGARIPAWPAAGSAGRAGYRWGIIPRWRMWTEARDLGRARLRAAAAAGQRGGGGDQHPGLGGGPGHAGPADLRQGPAERWPVLRRRCRTVVLHTGPQLAAAAVIGGLVLLAAPQLTRGLAVADGALARLLLGPRRDLAARVREVEISRERVVDAAEAERRRIERDLHDGAQQRLVALAMELGRAKAKFADDLDAARELVDQAHVQAKEALTELRNLVRGVHPPVLTDRGLDAALSGLAALCPVPVDVHVDVPVRPKSSVEAVAYFVVAEALTNVAKHSRASHAKVVVEGHGYPGTLTVMISDDGIGGADIHGPGLSGLADRVSGVDGRLSVESPVGGPTIIAAELPCG